MSNIKVSMDTEGVLEKITAMPKTYTAINEAYEGLSDVSGEYADLYEGESSLIYDELFKTVESDVSIMLDTVLNLNSVVISEVNKNTTIDNISNTRANVK
jgi:hypothetical protein